MPRQKRSSDGIEDDAAAPGSLAVPSGAPVSKKRRKSEGADLKSPMSKSLLKMKFMQKRSDAEETMAQNEGGLASPGAPTPKKGKSSQSSEPTLFGRRSFGGFNPAMEDAEKQFDASFDARLMPAKPAATAPEDDTDQFRSYISQRKKSKAGGGGGRN